MPWYRIKCLITITYTCIYIIFVKKMLSSLNLINLRKETPKESWITFYIIGLNIKNLSLILTDKL